MGSSSTFPYANSFRRWVHLRRRRLGAGDSQPDTPKVIHLAERIEGKLRRCPECGQAVRYVSNRYGQLVKCEPKPFELPGTNADYYLPHYRWRCDEAAR